jgi:hypothetical protein
MLILCAVSAYSFLISPLDPIRFNLTTIAGVALFLVVQQALTVSFGLIGIKLNIMSDRDERITGKSLQQAFRRWRGY